MIYEFKMLEESGEEVIYLFDNETAQLMDENGKSVFGDVRRIDAAKAISAQNPGRKSSDVKTLKIQLGLKCNFSCSYCLQTIHIKNNTDSNVEDAKEFLAKLDTWLTSDPDRVEFWGGEPFVYYKKLKVLIPELRKRLPKADMLIITNGSLLNDEIVDFIIEQDISVAVSHDGPGQEMRGKEPLEDETAFNAMQRLVDERTEKFSFNSVITAKNKEIGNIVRFFKERFGEHCNVSFEGIVSFYNESTLDASRLSDDDLVKISDELFYSIVDGTLAGSSYESSVISVINKLSQPYNLSANLSKCSMDSEHKIAVDLNGNIMTCQNTGAGGEHYVGSVYDIENAALKSSTHWMNRSNCKTCPVLVSCGGGCMYQKGIDFEESCRADFYQAYGVLRAAIYMMTGLVLVSINKRLDENIIAVG